MNGIIERIKFLESLSAISDWVGLDYIRLAREEVDDAIISVESSNGFTEDDKNKICNKLRLIHKLLVDGDMHKASGELRELSRPLWEDVRVKCEIISQL